jgi:hypothetical protein
VIKEADTKFKDAEKVFKEAEASLKTSTALHDSLNKRSISYAKLTSEK